MTDSLLILNQAAATALDELFEAIESLLSGIMPPEVLNGGDPLYALEYREVLALEDAYECLMDAVIASQKPLEGRA